MTAMTISALLLAILIGLAVLGAAALGSLLIWVIIFAWRHIIAPGKTDTRLEDLEYRVDALEDAPRTGDRLESR